MGSKTGILNVAIFKYLLYKLRETTLQRKYLRMTFKNCTQIPLVYLKAVHCYSVVTRQALHLVIKITSGNLVTSWLQLERGPNGVSR